jgi:hypothetical protein
MRSSFVIFPARAPQRWAAARIAGSEYRHEFIEGISGLEGPFSPILAVLEQLQYRGGSVLLALPSELCLCAVVDDSGLRKSSRQNGMLFRLEEQLPLAAEDVEADFVPGNGRCVGVAWAAGPALALIEALEGEGIAIASVCPAALLIADEVCQRERSNSTPDVLLLSTDHHVDAITILDGRLSDWALLPLSTSIVDLHLRRLRLERSDPQRVATIGCGGEFQAELGANSQINLVEELSANPRELAARAADRVLVHNARPPVELRRGRLACHDPLRFIRAPVRCAALAAMAFLLVVGISMFWRAERYERLAQAAEFQQREAFHIALPRQTPPPLIVSRLMSEEKRLAGISGTSATLPPSLSALPVLRDVLRGLPPQVRFRLLELRFDPSHFYLEGQSLDHGSAEQITESLRQSTGFQVDQPHTQQLAGEDVTFEISASVPSGDLEGAVR